ncbi:UPF0462 protein C4orf33 homolog [Limulus polyphemus]|uniref:UPF0462 protein C4orf33 homolog n=1 Tax=Limulus polyphemus TaxID=6850 RepID=A0ABM1BI28_LIMPO|nr:UPF0462 protein C4orf33 homolog [Limulus polyphemus]
MTFKINRTWDDHLVDHAPVSIDLSRDSTKGLVIMKVNAPFFNDPTSPEGPPGEPFFKLWDYEVVEAFFLAKDDKYLEVELSPHGQHLLLLLNGRRNAIKHSLPLNYTTTISFDQWTGIAEIPVDYFPPNVDRFNAYAIHGSGKDRMYESLYPVPSGSHTSADFHRLEYFRPIPFTQLIPNNAGSPLSEVWRKALGQ